MRARRRPDASWCEPGPRPPAAAPRRGLVAAGRRGGRAPSSDAEVLVRTLLEIEQLVRDRLPAGARVRRADARRRGRAARVSRAGARARRRRSSARWRDAAARRRRRHRALRGRERELAAPPRYGSLTDLRDRARRLQLLIDVESVAEGAYFVGALEAHATRRCCGRAPQIDGLRGPALDGAQRAPAPRRREASVP